MNALLKWGLVFGVLVGSTYALAWFNAPAIAQENADDRFRITDEEARLSSYEDRAHLPELNRRTLNFAIAHLGQQVGNGQCTSLVAEALRASGARLGRGFTFGRELGGNERWLPGDIIQFTNCVFKDSSGAALHVGSPDHSSIIYSIHDRSTVMLNQNSNHDLRTQKTTLDFGSMLSGSYRVYRPVSDREQSALQNNSVHNTSDLTNLSAILQQPVVAGPMHQVRADILERIRRLQDKGVNTYAYRHMFQEIEKRASTSDQNQSAPMSTDLSEAIEALTRQLTIRETQSGQSSGTTIKTYPSHRN
jgi:hypothetical protein